MEVAGLQRMRDAWCANTQQMIEWLHLIIRTHKENICIIRLHGVEASWPQQVTPQLIQTKIKINISPLRSNNQEENNCALKATSTCLASWVACQQPHREPNADILDTTNGAIVDSTSTFFCPFFFLFKPWCTQSSFYKASFYCIFNLVIFGKASHGDGGWRWR